MTDDGAEHYEAEIDGLTLFELIMWYNEHF